MILDGCIYAQICSYIFLHLFWCSVGSGIFAHHVDDNKSDTAIIRIINLANSLYDVILWYIDVF